MERRRNHSAIILHSHFNGLSIIQALGRNGISCLALDHKNSIAQSSRYCDFELCPNPETNESDFISFLVDKCKKQDTRPVIFPTSDYYAYSIAKNTTALEGVAMLCVSSWDTVKMLIHKKEFYEIGALNKYSTPNTYNINNLLTLADNCFPIVAKPEYQGIPSDERDNQRKNSFFSKQRLIIIKSKKELERTIDELGEYVKYYLFQEYINGISEDMFTVGIYANKSSEIKNLFSGRKIRGYPTVYGDCVVGENYQLPKMIIDLVIRIVKELRITGIAEFEFKRDIMDGRYKLIEVNPRSWSWVGITPKTGINLPLCAYQDLVGEAVSYKDSLSIPEGKYRYIRILDDFQHVVFDYKKEHPQWHQGIISYLAKGKYRNTVFAEFNAYDYKISLILIKQFLKDLKLRVMR